jgi:hypothetical protein
MRAEANAEATATGKQASTERAYDSPALARPYYGSHLFSLLPQQPRASESALRHRCKSVFFGIIGGLNTIKNGAKEGKCLTYSSLVSIFACNRHHH